MNINYLNVLLLVALSAVLTACKSEGPATTDKPGAVVAHAANKATAQGETHIIECQRSSIQALLESDSEFARTMMHRFAVMLQESRRRVELLSVKSANERILMALYDGLLVEDITSFAATIGLAPETVYRSLAQLSKNGQIIKSARGLYQLAIKKDN